MSSVYGCIANGLFCNNQGDCTSGKCICRAGWTGKHCEQPVVSDSGSDSTATVLGAVLGSVVPVVAILLLLLVCLALLAVRMSRRKIHNEWEMDFEELEMAEQLGVGGCAHFLHAPPMFALTVCVSCVVSWIPDTAL
jgi:hypothetical protein